jgi:hypothetical protein
MNTEDQERFLRRIRSVALKIMQHSVSASDRELFILAEEIDQAAARLLDRETAANYPPLELKTDDPGVPPHLLTSEKSQTFARTLRHAADLACEVDRERGYNPEDSIGEVLSDMAAQAEAEAFGPKE